MYTKKRRLKHGGKEVYPPKRESVKSDLYVPERDLYERDWKRLVNVTKQRRIELGVKEVYTPKKESINSDLYVPERVLYERD